MVKKIFLINLMVLSLCGCTRDWTSPDGVHYWKTPYGLTPRYNKEGNLVIDE